MRSKMEAGTPSGLAGGTISATIHKVVNGEDYDVTDFGQTDPAKIAMDVAERDEEWYWKRRDDMKEAQYQKRQAELDDMKFNNHMDDYEKDWDIAKDELHKTTEYEDLEETVPDAGVSQLPAGPAAK